MEETENNLVNTGCTIKQYQKEWFDKNSINFSDWVRKRIDEAMGGQNGIHNE